MSDDHARHLAFVADDLERRQYPLAGVVRRGAQELRRLQALEDVDAADERPRCLGCGRLLNVAATGRPPKTCSSTCRQRVHRQRVTKPR